MAAIALAESSGNSDAESSYNDNGSKAQGLWQIEMPLNASYVPGGNAFNPAANAVGAVRILASQGPDAWEEAYTSGAYKRYMTAGTSENAVFGVKYPGWVESLLDKIGAGGAGTPGGSTKGESSHLGKQEQKVAENAGNSVLDALGLGELLKIAKFLTSESGWLRIAKVAGGGILLLWGINGLTGVGDTAVSAVSKVAAVGG
jgi:hypothetical protein